MVPDLDELVHGTVLVFFGMAVGAGSELLSRVFMARYLLPGDYGSITIGISVLELITLLALVGFPGGLTRELSTRSDKRELLSGTVYFVISVSIIISIFGLISAPVLSHWFGTGVSLAILYIFLLGVPLYSFVRISIAAFRAVNNARAKLIVQNITMQGGQLALVILFISFGLETLAFAIAWVLPLLLGALISIILMRWSAELEMIFPPPISSFEKVHSLIKFSIPLLVSGMVWMMLQKIDNLLIATFLPSSQVGIYDAAFTFGRVFLLIPAAFGFLLLPALSQAYDDENYRKMKNTYQYFTKWMVFLALPVLGVFLFFPQTLLVFAFGPQYQGGSLPLVIIAIGFFVHVIFGLNGNGLIAIGKSTEVFYGSVIAFVSNIGLNLALIPLIGIVGAATSSMVAYTAINLFWTYLLFRHSKIQPFSKPLMMPASISLVLFTVVSRFVATLERPLWVVVTAVIMFSVVHLCSILLFGGLEKEDEELLASLYNAIGN